VVLKRSGERSVSDPGTGDVGLTLLFVFCSFIHHFLAMIFLVSEEYMHACEGITYPAFPFEHGFQITNSYM